MKLVGVLMTLFASMTTPSSNKNTRIDWKIRPATPSDAAAVQELLQTSYSQLLAADYEADLLATALPLICQANPELLTCGTWYVVFHPTSHQLVGCGGWTGYSPMAQRQNTAKEDARAETTDTVKQNEPPHLRHFACHPQWTRRGVASLIWKRTLQDMTAAYRGEIPDKLEVFSTLSAVPFYASLGFCQTRPLEIPLNDGACLFPAMLLTRQTPAAEEDS